MRWWHFISTVHCGDIRFLIVLDAGLSLFELHCILWFSSCLCNAFLSCKCWCKMTPCKRFLIWNQCWNIFWCRLCLYVAHQVDLSSVGWISDETFVLGLLFFSLIPSPLQISVLSVLICSGTNCWPELFSQFLYTSSFYFGTHTHINTRIRTHTRSLAGLWNPRGVCM